MAMPPVSRSRISPTMMMFGSCRRNAFSAAAKVSPISVRTSTWLMPIRLYSTGSSAVMMLTSIVLIRGQRGVERRRLARARRAGDQHHAVRVQDRLHQILLRLRLEAELVEVERQVALVEDSEHDLLAEQRRQRRDAEVDDPVAHLQLDAAVLRHAALGDVELRHDLDARDERRLHLERRLHDLEQRAVDAVAHPDLVLERLEVDVARAPLHRVGQDAVDQLDDRRVVDLRLGGASPLPAPRRPRRLRPLASMSLRRLCSSCWSSARSASRSASRSVNSPAMTGKRSYRVMNLRSSSSAEVGRVGHRDGERAALALEREDQVLGRQVGGDQLEDPGVDLEAGEVHRRHAVLPRQDLGELDLGDEAELDQDVAQPVLARLLLGQGLRELLPREETLAQQDLAESITVVAAGR